MSAVLQLVKQTKKCCLCKEEKHLSEFSKNLASKDKLQYKCRTCDVEYQRKRRAADPQKAADYSRQYQKNKRKDFNYRLQMLINASKQRASIKGREHSISVADLKELYPKDGCCPIFGMKLEFNSAGFRENSPSIDRIDSQKGYTRDNIQIISWKANRIKGYASVEELEMLLSYLKDGG